MRFASGLAQGVSRPETRPRPPVGDRARGTRRGLLPPPEGSHFSHLFLPFHTFFFIFPTSSYFFLPSPTFSLTFPDLLQPPPAFSDLNDFEGHSEYSECSSEQRSYIEKVGEGSRRFEKVTSSLLVLVLVN